MNTIKPDLAREKITIKGMVQGVGFRPFVYQLAQQLGVQGAVSNTSAGVVVDAQAPAAVIDIFKSGLYEKAPPIAVIESIEAIKIAVNSTQDQTFLILESEDRANSSTLIGTDLATCDACLKELFDPTDRRYRYPFINCTHCGPRYTIIRDIPYDRPTTSMAPFEMCATCQAEYDNPANRRFHAQPNACPNCGPQVWPEEKGERVTLKRESDLFAIVGQALKSGSIVAVKGIGGFHLACNAQNDGAIARLRKRKGRRDKPFAIMARDIATAKTIAAVSEAEQELLSGPARPIVLLHKKKTASLSQRIAPGNRSIGVMLPYSPLHHLLLAECPILVMTSGNLSGEPIIFDNEMARSKLAGLADLMLMHDRQVENRCDDAVLRLMPTQQLLPIRRARGTCHFRST